MRPYIITTVKLINMTLSSNGYSLPPPFLWWKHMTLTLRKFHIQNYIINYSHCAVRSPWTYTFHFDPIDQRLPIALLPSHPWGPVLSSLLLYVTCFGSTWNRVMQLLYVSLFFSDSSFHFCEIYFPKIVDQCWYPLKYTQIVFYAIIPILYTKYLSQKYWK